MATTGTVTLKHKGKTYAATYTLEHGMVHVKTHTETRSVELGDSEPERVARDALKEIVSASRSQ